jgi:dipeptidyl aminopeptidase/acylaminoacyl peptidase
MRRSIATPVGRATLFAVAAVAAATLTRPMARPATAQSAEHAIARAPAAQQSAAPRAAAPQARPAATPVEAFTITDILSAPFPSGLVAAPTGDRVAWVRNDRGVRNIWVAAAPEWRARQVTGYDRDVGQDLSGLEFLADGRRLLYGVGGTPNRAGEHPNPASLPDGPEVALYLLDTDTGEQRGLPGGSSRALSPDGSRLAFVRGPTVHVAPIPAGPTAPTPSPTPSPARLSTPTPTPTPTPTRLPTATPPQSPPLDSPARPLFQARGNLRSLAWSPDGARLAFVSARGGHAFVGVYDTASHRITWLAPSVDRDGDPVWSPAGDRIAFLRVPSRRDALPFFAQPESLPWSVLVGDPATGTATEVWRAPEGRGSAFRGVTGSNLLWTADNRLVFPWEGGGWTNLWSVPAGGGEASPLTPGDFEVYHVALAADRRAILYSSNQGDNHRLHLWRVPADGSAPPTPLTGGDAAGRPGIAGTAARPSAGTAAPELEVAGIEWSPVEPAPGVVVFMASGPTTPARVEIMEDGRRRVLEADSPPPSFPRDRLATPELVAFPADDGLPVHGQLFSPPANVCGPGPYPGLLFLHGGSRRQMFPAFHHGLYYHHSYAFNQYMAAARCWAVLSVNFRSGIGYGLEFREAADYGAGGASELRDVTGAARWLAARDDVDGRRVALWGGSYGGYLTALGLARAPELFAAGVDVHGVHDWNVTIRNFVPDYAAALRPEAARSAFESSPLYDLSRWRAPVLLVHGDDDRNVPFAESVTLAEELRLRGVPVETLVFPDEVHSFLLWENWVRTFEAAAEFLERRVR